MDKQKVVLLSNLGNRNLLYKGEYIDHNHFRELTKKYLIDFDNIKDQLNLIILTDLIDFLKNDGIIVEHVVLFYSDQNPPNERDTIYEAKIIRLKLLEREGINTTLYPLKCNPTNTEQLMRRYRYKLKTIKNNFPAKYFILCDASGTPQQKIVTKILLEFLFDEDQFDVYSVFGPEDGKPGVIEKQYNNEYRTVIVYEQIDSLIHYGNYQAALQLLPNRGNELVKKLVELGALRFDLDTSFSRIKLNNFKKCEIKRFPILKYLIDESVPIGNYYIEFKEILSEKEYVLLCEQLAITQFKWSIKRYKQAILDLHIIIETYLQNCISNVYDIDFKKDYDEAMTKVKEICRYQSNQIKSISYMEIYQLGSGVPLLIALCLITQTQNNTHQELIKQIMLHNNWWYTRLNDSNSNRLDWLRNKIVHEGKIDIIDKIASYENPSIDDFLVNLYQLIGMPKINYYDLLNNCIRECM